MLIRLYILRVPCIKILPCFATIILDAASGILIPIAINVKPNKESGNLSSKPVTFNLIVNFWHYFVKYEKI